MNPTSSRLRGVSPLPSHCTQKVRAPRSPAIRRGEVVDIVRKSWNQLETLIFEWYEIIKEKSTLSSKGHLVFSEGTL